MPSDYTYNNGSVPSTKTNLNSLGTLDPTKAVQDIDLNLLTAAVVSLRSAVLAGQHYGLVDNASAPLSTSGNVRLRSFNGRLQNSRGGGAFADVTPHVDVTEYGADRFGLTDSGPGFNAAIAAAAGRDVYVPPGTYKIVTPINGTGLLGLTIRGCDWKSILIGHCTDQPVIDIVGSLKVTISRLWIEGNGTDMPSCGILAGRTTGDASAGDHTFDTNQITGYYGVACYVGVSSETSVHCGTFSYENFQPGASVACLWSNNLQTTSSVNPAGGSYPAISSPYATLSNTPAGGNTVHTFLHGTLGMDNSSSDHTANVLQIENMRGCIMHGTFMYGYGARGIWVRNSGASFLDWTGASENELNTDAGIDLDATATVEHLKIDGYLGGAPLYGQTGSTIKNSTLRGRWGTSAAYTKNASFDTVVNSTLDLDGLDTEVRTKAEAVNFGMSAGTLTLPSNIRGCDYQKIESDPAGSGHTIATRHINDDGKYDDRLKTTILNAACVQRRPKYIAGSDFTALAGTLTPNFWDASGWDITLSGNLTVANWTPITGGPQGNTGLAQDFTDLFFCFIQDGTGGRTVTWGSSYRGMSQWAIDPTPGAVSTLHFVLRPDGNYWLVGFNSNGKIPLSGTDVTSSGTLFTSGSRRHNRLIVSGNLTLSNLYEIVVADTGAAAGDFTLTLPSAATAGTGRVYEIFRTIDVSHKVTIAPGGADTIGDIGNNSFKMERGSSIVLRSDGISNWEIVHVHGGQMVCSANFTMAELTEQLLVNTSGGAVTVTLPTAGKSIRKMRYLVKRSTGDTNNLVLDAGASNIEGAGTLTLTTAFAYVELICDSSQWYVVGRG